MILSTPAPPLYSSSARLWLLLYSKILFLIIQKLIKALSPVVLSVLTSFLLCTPLSSLSLFVSEVYPLLSLLFARVCVLLCFSRFGAEVLFLFCRFPFARPSPCALSPDILLPALLPAIFPFTFVSRSFHALASLSSSPFVLLSASPPTLHSELCGASRGPTNLKKGPRAAMAAP